MYRIEFKRFRRGKGWQSYYRPFNTLSELVRHMKVLKPKYQLFVYILHQLNWRERQIVCMKYCNASPKEAIIFLKIHFR